MLEIDRKREITGLERVASYHLLSTEIVTVLSHLIAYRIDVEVMRHCSLNLGLGRWRTDNASCLPRV